MRRQLGKHEIIESMLGSVRNEGMCPSCPRPKAFSVEKRKLDHMPESQRTVGNSHLSKIRKCGNQRFTAE
jgi:hypothetical protein